VALSNTTLGAFLASINASIMACRRRSASRLAPA
jgi:hypothetical protein